MVIQIPGDHGIQCLRMDRINAGLYGRGGTYERYFRRYRRRKLGRHVRADSGLAERTVSRELTRPTGQGIYLIINHLLLSVVLLQRGHELDDIRVVCIELIASAIKAEDEAAMVALWGHERQGRAGVALIPFFEEVQSSWLRTGGELYGSRVRAFRVA